MNFSKKLLNLIKQGESEMAILYLLENSFLYHSTDARGATLLHYAAQYNNANVAQFLLDKGCDVDIQDKKGITPLMISVINETDVTKILLSAGADIFKLNKERMSALHMLSAQRKIKFDIIQLFFEKLEKNYSTIEGIVEKLIDAGFSLYHALLFKDSKIIECMLQRGISVNSINPLNRFTAMHVAVLLEDFKSVYQLLQYGANVNVLNVIKANCLYYLYHVYPEHNNEKIGILEMLLNQGASMTSCTSDGIFQVYNTLVRGNRTAIRLLIDAGLNFRIRDVSNKNVLHYLALNCNAGVIEELKYCTKQLKVNALDKLRQSPLLVAVIHGNVYMVQFLLEQGARTNIADNVRGIPALFYAYGYKKKSNLKQQYHHCGEILLQYNADPQFVAEEDGETVTIFDAALRKNDAERMKPVVAHLAVLEKLGIQITKTTWEKINSHPLLKEYFHKCKQLLTQKVSEHVILFNLLTSDKRTMARYLKNENIVEKLENENYAREMMANYCYFYNTLDRRYREGKRFKELVDIAAGVICEIFQKRIGKTHLIVENVIPYLDDQSLHQLKQLYR